MVQQLDVLWYVLEIHVHGENMKGGNYLVLSIDYLVPGVVFIIYENNFVGALLLAISIAFFFKHLGKTK